MMKTLTKQGDRLIFEVDDPIRQLWRIDAKTPLTVTVDGDRLILEAQRDEVSDAEFDAAAAKVTTRYEQTFRKLAE
ncbi:MAG TPA: hypothetical protein VLI90_18605 [Tepidisphaeraceae bacterium]|nr:hypothetical protein [Tepidisphaeraceae bacterium]